MPLEMPDRGFFRTKTEDFDTFGAKMFALKHQFYDFLRLIGLRDRLRCPYCVGVGTWKPHGGWLDFEDERPVRRWLCKWCGTYIDASGLKFCEVGETCWEIVEKDKIIMNTPQLVLASEVGHHVNPWKG